MLLFLAKCPLSTQPNQSSPLNHQQQQQCQTKTKSRLAMLDNKSASINQFRTFLNTITKLDHYKYLDKEGTKKIMDFFYII